jgi:hypothetical protein
MRTVWLLVATIFPAMALAGPPVIPSTVDTQPFASYDEAPATVAGIVVVQNGEAEDPPNTDDINGFEYDGSTQFRFVDWRKIARALHLTDQG